MKIRAYAQGTIVEPSRSREQIERLVTRHGASKFASGWSEDGAQVEFVTHGRRVRFRVPLNCTEGETRRRWRSLYLAIKSRLDVVATGIETFDEAFLSHIVTSENVTVGEWIQGGDGSRLLGPIAE